MEGNFQHHLDLRMPKLASPLLRHLEVVLVVEPRAAAHTHHAFQKPTQLLLVLVLLEGLHHRQFMLRRQFSS